MRNSASDCRSPRVSEKGLTNCYVYHGSSMYPTFRRGDLLRVRPVGLDAIRVGDIVVFTVAETSRQMVHRVVRRRGKGLITRGDTSVAIDDDTLTADRLLGRVEWVGRVGTWRRVAGRFRGRLRARLLPGRIPLLTMIRMIRRLFRPVWRRIRNSRRVRSLVTRIWSPRLSVACFEASGSLIVKVTCGGRKLAHWQPGQGRPRIIKPYDLVLGLEGQEAALESRAKALEEVFRRAKADLAAARARYAGQGSRLSRPVGEETTAIQ